MIDIIASLNSIDCVDALQGLKNHAVTMFEVGKLCDESMDSLLGELEKVSLLDAEGEGEVSRYFQHAVSRFSFTKTLVQKF